MMNARGFGFVTPEDKPDDGDVFIQAPHLHGALHGDRVRVQIISRANGDRKRRGRIVSILEQSSRTFVCTFRAEHGLRYAECDDPKTPYLIRPHNIRKFNLKPGHKVLIEVLDEPKRQRPMILDGRIVDVLGAGSDPSVDILSIILTYGLPEQFPKEVLEQAASLEKFPSTEELARRIDRRQLKIVTIDGADAKDLDDGVYAERLDDGAYFLGVYIADVSHYVRENDPIDAEAYARGTSVYLVDRVLPMLPRELSNGICSLNAGVDRLALACEMRLSSEGRIESYEIFSTAINVHRRLTYSAVNNFYRDRPNELGELAQLLTTLKEIRDKRFRLRLERGAIDFDMPELKVRLDDRGRPLDVFKRRRDIAESVIEECMLAANETVARHMFVRKIPSLYRVHEPPALENMKKFNELLNAFGLNIKLRSTEKISPSDIQRVLDRSKGTRGEQTINAAALRAMQQARYSAENLGHFGLAAEFYTHFTSPIRRYPDLIVHRLLKETLADRLSSARRERLKKTLPEIARSASIRERLAADAERESTELKAVEYMKRYVGEEFDSTIVSVTSFGFFVELENGVEGLVRASTIDGDCYTFIESRFELIGELFGRAFRIGDRVRVRLVEANVRLRQLTFELVRQ